MPKLKIAEGDWIVVCDGAKALVLVNEKAGSVGTGDGERLIEALQAAGVEHYALLGAERMSRRLFKHAEDFDVIVVLGGDGTASAAAAMAPHDGPPLILLPGGTLNVLSMTKETFLTVFRLRKDGSLDTSFSGDGMTTITVPSSFDDNGFGSCMADGRIVVVRHAQGVGSDMNVQIFRVMPDGVLDPSFANGTGVLTLDMDQYVSGLANAEYPTGLNLDAAGNIFLSWDGTIHRVDAVTGIITRVSPTGGFTTPEGLRAQGTPADMEFDGQGRLYIDQQYGRYVFRITGLAGDTSPPVVTANVSGTPGNFGWYRSNVTVSWSVSVPASASREATAQGLAPCAPSTHAGGPMHC